jgi:hypothetical protein
MFSIICRQSIRRAARSTARGYLKVCNIPTALRPYPKNTELIGLHIPEPRNTYLHSRVYSEEARGCSEEARVYSEEARGYSEEARGCSEEARVYSEEARGYSEEAKAHDLGSLTPPSLPPFHPVLTIPFYFRG